jgi:hypothetical protein
VSRRHAPEPGRLHDTLIWVAICVICGRPIALSATTNRWRHLPRKAEVAA